MEASDPRRIVQQLLNLASDPDNQAFIVREVGCLAGLTAYLRHSDVEVATMAARAVWFLSNTASNRKALREHPGLMDGLDALSKSGNDKLRRVVSEARENCAEKPAPASAATGMPIIGAGFSLFAAYAAPASGPATPSATENTAPSESAAPSSSSVAASNSSWSFLGADRTGSSAAPPATPLTKMAMARPRPIKIHVEGIEEEYWRKRVETCLIRVPGVVSVTIHQRKEEVVVFARGKDDMLQRLLKALERLGVEGTAVDDSAPSSGASTAPRTPFSAVKMPQYLDDEDDSAYWGKGVMTSSTGTSSLEARLAAKRRAQQEKESAQSFLGKIGSGLGLW